MGIGTGLAAFDLRTPASIGTRQIGREIQIEEISGEASGMSAEEQGPSARIL